MNARTSKRLGCFNIIFSWIGIVEGIYAAAAIQKGLQ